MTPDAWFVRLVDVLASTPAHTTSQRDVGPDEVPVDDERALLLDLARIAAHTSERWTAPLTTYMAGRTLAGLDVDERIARLRALVDELDELDDANDDGGSPR